MENKNIIDYAQDGNAVDFRNALYASIQDKVTAHLDAQKEGIARNLINPQETQEVEQTEQSDENV